MQSAKKVPPSYVTTLEVKGGKNVKAKSLNRYLELYKPKLGVKLSPNAGNLKGENIFNIPIYYAAKHVEIIHSIKKGLFHHTIPTTTD